MLTDVEQTWSDEVCALWPVSGIGLFGLRVYVGSLS